MFFNSLIFLQLKSKKPIHFLETYCYTLILQSNKTLVDLNTVSQNLIKKRNTMKTQTQVMTYPSMSETLLPGEADSNVQRAVCYALLAFEGSAFITLCT